MTLIITKFQAKDAFAISDANELAGIKSIVPIEKLIQGYLTPGSKALTLMKDNIPIACGGIVNFQWHRGEAWLMTSPEACKFKKSLFKFSRIFLPKLAFEGEFNRVQATCFDLANGKFFEKLGFILETEHGLRGFGPNGETAMMYSRIF